MYKSKKKKKNRETELVPSSLKKKKKKVIKGRHDDLMTRRERFSVSSFSFSRFSSSFILISSQFLHHVVRDRTLSM